VCAVCHQHELETPHFDVDDTAIAAATPMVASDLVG
jgi:hypothetical protein